MANETGMPEDKKARLEAIRAANAAKKAQSGGEEAPAPVAAATVTAPAAATPDSRPAAGANMPDDKKARLEAIRAANAAKQADGGTSTAPVPAAPTPAPAAARPAATAAPAAARPATPAARPTPKSAILEDERIPLRVHLWRAAIGAVLGVILCVLLATMTDNYISGALWGAVLGALTGVLVISWPPDRTTGD